MDSASSRRVYETRLNRVLAYIDAHLDTPLNLPDLAAVAHFSAFHFHRLFAAWKGESVGDFVRRRRLERAALWLLNRPRASVLDVALAVGFGSGESFARAFRSHFACTPSQWRVTHRLAANGKRDLDSIDSKICQANNALVANNATHNFGAFLPVDTALAAAMKVKLVDRPDVPVAYLRHTGPYDSAITRFWIGTVYPWLVQLGLTSSPRFGVHYDTPDLVAPELCRYDACVQLPVDYVPSKAVLTTTLAGGRYAVLPFLGTNPEINAAWRALLLHWLPNSGLQPDARPCFEHYPVTFRYDAATGVFDCELWLPVAPL